MTDDPLTILTRFAQGSMSLPELEVALESQVRFRYLDTNERSVELYADLPAVAVSMGDLANALRRYLLGLISGRELSDWAATLRLLDCYDVECDEGSETLWHVLDLLMSPDAWGELTPERAEELLHGFKRGLLW